MLKFFSGEFQVIKRRMNILLPFYVFIEVLLGRLEKPAKKDNSNAKSENEFKWNTCFSDGKILLDRAEIFFPGVLSFFTA